MRLNHKKLRRLYVEERLQVRRRIGRKRAVVTRVPLVPAREPNQRWSMDFVHDALSDGRRFRILAVVDDYTRENLCLVADTSLPGGRVIRELEALVTRRGLPRQCVSDNGPEFAGLAVLGWAQSLHLDWHYIEPGPFDKLRVRATAECLHRELQWSPARRVPERDAVHHARPGSRRTRGMAARLQHRTTAQRARQSDADRLRGSQRFWSATGRGAALNRGLRAPACCNTGPHGSK